MSSSIDRTTDLFQIIAPPGHEHEQNIATTDQAVAHLRRIAPYFFRFLEAVIVKKQIPDGFERIEQLPSGAFIKNIVNPTDKKSRLTLHNFCTLATILLARGMRQISQPNVRYAPVYLPAHLFAENRQQPGYVTNPNAPHWILRIDDGATQRFADPTYAQVDHRTGEEIRVLTKEDLSDTYGYTDGREVTPIDVTHQEDLSIRYVLNAFRIQYRDVRRLTDIVARVVRGDTLLLL